MSAPKRLISFSRLLQRFTAAPKFPGDEEKSRLAFRLVVVALAGILIAIVYSAVWLLIVPDQHFRLVFALPLLIIFSLVIILVKVGRVQLAVTSLLTGTWLVIAAMVTTSGGTRSPLFALFILAVMTSVLLSGWRTAVFFGGASILFGAGLVIASDRIPLPTATASSAWLSQTAILAFVMLQGYIIIRDMRRSLDQAQRALAERDQTEMALRESEARFRLISSVTSDYTFSTGLGIDESMQYLLLTGAFETITGYTPEEFYARGGWRALLHPDDLAQDERDLEVLRENKRVVSEIRIIRKDGEIRWVRVYAQPAWDEAGSRLVRVDGGVQDITEAKRLEAELRNYTIELERLVDERTKALRRAKEQLEMVLNNASNALAFADSAGDVLIANPAFRAAFDERGSRYLEFVLWSLSTEDEITLVCDAMLKVIYDGERHRLETRLRSPEGVERDVELTLIPLTVAEDTRRNGVLLSGHDITELKEMQRFRSRLVADVVHDLAAPIQGLSTRLYLLKQRPEQIAEHVRALDNQLKHLRNLLDDLRTMSDLDRGQMALKLAPCHINDLVQRVYDTYSPVAADKHLTFGLNLGANLPAVQLDERQIERALVNLVSNAVYYTGESRWIGVETAAESSMLVVRVADQGIGISAADLPRVFDRFFRTSEGRSFRAGGSGLGLAITREIIEMHGGSVGVSSEVGRGSVFTIRLPLDAQTRGP
ncbi:MAG: PAS domain S-box protein [Anaerolineae bacterium]|nr:PAS domain S-box protein [Anaerolineae bacterium]NUQ05813.1 PAS domain S-box protein [Anaerolineae bacterium]